jgi:hypothetical protein
VPVTVTPLGTIIALTTPVAVAGPALEIAVVSLNGAPRGAEVAPSIATARSATFAATVSPILPELPGCELSPV